MTGAGGTTGAGGMGGSLPLGAGGTGGEVDGEGGALGAAGFGYGGYSADAGGVDAEPPPLPPICLKYESMRAVEERLIVPGCGVLRSDPDTGEPPPCHNSFFVPTLDRPEVVAANLLLEEPKRMSCKTDPYVNKQQWWKSWLIVKSDPALDGMDIKAAAKCLSTGLNGKARMPYLMAALSTEDFDCLRWYVYQLATH
jgi:hypothetical protein